MFWCQKIHATNIPSSSNLKKTTWYSCLLPRVAGLNWKQQLLAHFSYLLQGWETAIPSTEHAWVVVENLQPGTPYIMLVRAHNSYGTSQPSPVTDYIRTTGSSQPSQGWTERQIQSNMNDTTLNFISLDVLSSTAINATWEVREVCRRVTACDRIGNWLGGSIG